MVIFKFTSIKIHIYIATSIKIHNVSKQVSIQINCFTPYLLKLILYRYIITSIFSFKTLFHLLYLLTYSEHFSFVRKSTIRQQNNLYISNGREKKNLLVVLKIVPHAVLYIFIFLQTLHLIVYVISYHNLVPAGEGLYRQ